MIDKLLYFFLFGSRHEFALSPLRGETLVKLLDTFMRLFQGLLSGGYLRLKVSDADLVLFLLLAQEGNFILARLLLYTEPLCLFIGLHKLGLKVF